jgi:hypothetical protein
MSPILRRLAIFISLSAVLMLATSATAPCRAFMGGGATTGTGTCQ